MHDLVTPPPLVILPSPVVFLEKDDQKDRIDGVLPDHPPHPISSSSVFSPRSLSEPADLRISMLESDLQNTKTSHNALEEVYKQCQMQLKQLMIERDTGKASIARLSSSLIRSTQEICQARADIKTSELAVLENRAATTVALKQSEDMHASLVSVSHNYETACSELAVLRKTASQCEPGDNTALQTAVAICAATEARMRNLIAGILALVDVSAHGAEHATSAGAIMESAMRALSAAAVQRPQAARRRPLMTAGSSRRKVVVVGGGGAASAALAPPPHLLPPPLQPAVLTQLMPLESMSPSHPFFFSASATTDMHPVHAAARLLAAGDNFGATRDGMNHSMQTPSHILLGSDDFQTGGGGEGGGTSVLHASLVQDRTDQ